MRLWVLGSGSRGNALLLECGDSRLLIDAGFAPGTIARRMKPTGIAPESIDALVVTHEHTDHVRGAAAAVARWGWPVYASAGTTAASPELGGLDVRTFEAGATLSFGDVDLRTVATSHDAAEPVGFTATVRTTGARAGVCYDLGVVTSNVHAAFHDLDLLALESNHDEAMLRGGPYPRFLQKRIASDSGHLSNGAAAEMARSCVQRRLRGVVLAHLSERCNTPAAALECVGGALRASAFRGRLTAARQSEVTGPFGPGAETRQLTLAL